MSMFELVDIIIEKVLLVVILILTLYRPPWFKSEPQCDYNHRLILGLIVIILAS